MTAPRRIFAAPVASLLAIAAAAAQNVKAPAAYPERDILSPFRKVDEIVAPPDKVMAQFRIMRSIADSAPVIKDFDKSGREIVDDDRWRAARAELTRLHIDAGHLAQVIRGSRNADDRDLAFYGMFYCTGVDDVLNLISHIPGEPVAQTRAKAYPRAVAFLRATIGQKWGDLSNEDRQVVLRNMPAPGSPAAMAMGIKRAPRDEDTLHQINLRPFFQMLDQDGAVDQAQALWFLKECFMVRRDLAAQWTEPALPRIAQLLESDDAAVRNEAAGLLLAIGPKDLKALPADADAAARREFVRRAGRALFPPIRPLSAGLLLLLPSPEREALFAAGRQALADGSIGETVTATDGDQRPFRGLRIDRVPAELEVLRIPVGAIVTAINGTPVVDLAQVKKALASAFETRDASGGTRQLSAGRVVVDYMLDGKPRAMEYRVE
jgi:hypothetical protein